MSYVLYICPTSPLARERYSHTAAAYNARPYEERDAGFDLYCDTTEFVFHNLNERHVQRISQNCSAAFYDTERCLFRAFWLLPRSSISRTPLRLANSVGLIDAGYRGTIQAATEFTSPSFTEEPISSNIYRVNEGERYFQLASPDLLPWSRVEVVDEIPGGPTLRGSGGFGSTGRHVHDLSGGPAGGAGVAST